MVACRRLPLVKISSYTNMLTWRDLEAHCAHGRLVKWSPRQGSHPPEGGRALYMSPKVYADFEQSPWPGSTGEKPTQTRRRRAAMRTALERYWNGDAINLRHDIKELGSEPVNAKMRGFWEFRSQGPMEETRLFGFFAFKGAFVSLSFKGRGHFASDRGAWHAERNACEAQWSALSNGHLYLAAPWPVLTRSQLLAYTG